MSLSNLELGCQIWWGKTVDPDECVLTDVQENPESLLMAKEKCSGLSDEAKLVIKEIINLPDAMFTATGRVLKTELSSWMRRKHNWDDKKLEKYKHEIKLCLGGVL